MKTKYMWLIFAFCILLARPVDAYYGASLEVTVLSSQVCPCDIISSSEIEIEITNIGTGSDTYYFSLELPEGWSGFVQPQVTLAAGETSLVDPVWITPSCGVSPGEYTVTVVAESGMSGKKVTEEVEINVMGCHDVEISAQNYVETCEKEEVVTEVEIRNLGKVDETISLSVSPDWAVITPNTIEVDAGESRTVSLRLMPADGLTGNQDITIRAESQTSYAEAEFGIRLGINKCYVFNASISPATDTVCIGTSGEYYLRIDNVGTNADTYRIVAPDWVEAEDETVSVESNERESVKLTVTPPARGERDITIAVSSLKHPTAVIDAKSVISAIDCRSVAVSISPAEKNVCKGEGTNFVVRIQNTGTVITSFDLDASIGTLERKKLVLGPGEAHNVILDIESATRVGSNVVSVHARDGNVSDEDSATLHVKNCYDVDFSVTPAEFQACKDDVITYSIEVRNEGELKDDYTLKYLSEQHDFDLDPGETERIEAKIPVNYLWGSTNTVLFELHSSHAVHAERPVELNIRNKEDCHSVELTIINGKEKHEKKTSVPVGKGVAVKFNIVNKGLRADHYNIIVNGPDWMHISKDSFFLNPMQEEIFYMYFSPPYATPEREYKITIIADSEKALSLSGVEIDAVVTSKPPDENVTGEDDQNVTDENVTGNITGGGLGGLTGLFLFAGKFPIEIATVVILSLAVVVIIMMRFVIFR